MRLEPVQIKDKQKQPIELMKVIQFEIKIADINSKYFFVSQSSNFKHSLSYGSNFY